MNIATIKVSGVKAVTNDYPTIPAGIVGATVTFEFTDPAWDGLNKTAVFRGCVTRDVLMTGNVVRIPAETVAQACPFLFVGVYGTDAADNLVIPTLWLSLGTVRDAADPSGDPGTNPDLPIWAQLQDRVEALESGTPSDPSSPGTPGRPGEDGEDGGYYTPAVTQPSSDTVEFAFSPSKPDMPAVDPVQVKLPVGQGSGGNVDLTGVVRSVNGQTPDENGNVEIAVSGGTAVASVEPAEDDMPKVFLTGSEFSNMTTAKNEVNMGLEYISKTDKFKAAIKIKFQGNTSLTFPKKNFTIKMYTNDSYEDKLKKNFKDWNHNGNKYVLKANYIDHSHARNVVSARLWGEVVASRPDYDSLPVELRNSPRNGAIDGFPVKLYVNGNYEGVYTWNVGKDDWMWGMDEDNVNHVLMCAESNVSGANPCNFNALWNGVNESNWTVEVGTNSNTVKTALNNLIQFVMDNDGNAFRNGIGQYLDIQSAIDYYIFQYEICGLDGLAKNMLLATYDGKKWMCGAYDMDAVFGLFWDGKSFVSAVYRCPEDYQAKASLLWERIETNYSSELKARQAELRKTVLSYSNMVTHFERFMDVIGLDLYAEDLNIYAGIPSGSTNNIKQIRNYIRDRQAYVDAEFAAMSDPVHCTGISLNTNTLTFTAEGSQTLTATVTPDGCTDVVTWESNNTSVATVQNGVVTAVANGSAVITVRCGEYSANCSVAVSGIYEAIPCTGISLDKTELTFIGDGTQTITATVTPSDTTDTVVWVSSEPSVASITVDGNVCTVNSENNGSAIITATCGEHTAECSVTVNTEEINILSGAVITAGYYITKSGAEGVSDTDACSGYIDVSDYTGKTVAFARYNTNSRVAFYDSDKNCINAATLIKAHVIPNNAKYMRVSLAQYKQAQTPLRLYTLSNNIATGYTVEEGTPMNAGDTNSCHKKINVIPGETYFLAGAWGYAILGASGNIVQSRSDFADVITIPEGASYLAPCAKDSLVSDIFVAKEFPAIGSIDVPRT